MILDERTEFIDDLAIPAAGTTVVGDVIDTSVARDLGNGGEIYWYASVGATAAAGGTSVNIQLISSAASDMSSPVVHAQSGVIATADLTAGKRIAMQELPIEGTAYKRYLGVQVVVVGVFTAGALSSGLTLNGIGWKAYADTVN